LPALSTNLIAASDSASKASAKNFAHASNKPADGSPFAMLLAATAQQSSRKQISASDKSDAAPKPPAQADDTQVTQTNTARADTAQTTPSRTRSDDKRDKKDDQDKTDQDDDAEADAPRAQAPVPATPIPVAIPMTIPMATPAAVPLGMPARPQTFDLAAAASGSDPGQTVPTGGDDSKVDPASPQVQPVNNNVPAVQAPASPPVQTAGDDSDVLNVTPPPVAVAAATQNRVDDSKPAPGKAAAAKPVAADQPDATQNPKPTPATDANAVAQMAIPTTPAAPGPLAAGTASNAAAAPQIASIATTATDKSSSRDAAAAAAKSEQPIATDTPAAIPTQETQETVAATAVPTNGKDTAKSSDKSNSDTKPVHVADAQPSADMPAPAPQAAPPPAMPPHMAVNAFGIAAPAAAGNSMVTSSVQVTEADADPTPDMDALAVTVAARAMSGAKQFQIRLDPPELGRVDVRLSIDASGKTQAHMTADQPQTLDLLQKDATTLTQALRDAGLDVSQSGLNFSLRGQDRQNDDDNNGGAQGRRTNLIATRAIQAAQNPNAISFNGAAADARVDIHV
jgi:flagellar hook-length control protein FliK